VNQTSTSSRRRTLRARYLFPVTSEPIPDGLLRIAGERIVAVGRQPGEEQVEDLGNVALLPGLVNAHTHLEFSDLAAPLGTPGMDFVEWIRRIIELFRQGRSPLAGPIGRGLRECMRSGTTTLGEIAQPGWPAEALKGVALDATVFLELIAPTPERVAPLLQLAPQHLQAADAQGRWRPGLSPHAPYSVLPQLLHAAVSLSATGRVPLAFHLAESREELQLLRSGNGPFRDFSEQLGTCQADLFGRGTRPLDYLHTLAAAHQTLVIHGNYLDREEIAFLARHCGRMSVVYCPRTHAYFRHDAYPLLEMLAAGVTVALGTDSRASSPDLSLLAEMRCVAKRYPTLARNIVLRLGTINGARALGRDRQIGSLEPGKYANLAVVALPDRDAVDPHDLLLDSDQPVVATWFRGMLNAEC
jgi:cytosine/adenosine deaminase-related metal-dependent hydrolase